MTKGVFDLPVPDGTMVVQPQALLIPPVAFDTRGYRLGYGGGYFDRTLASMTPQPLKIGVAFELSRIATIYPQCHDVAMDFIVTEARIYHVTEHARQCIGGTDESAELSERLVRERTFGARQRETALGANIPVEAHVGARRYASSPFNACGADPAEDDM